MLTDTEVDALVVTAENDDILECREAICLVLIVADAIGRGEDNLVVVALALELLDAAEYGLNLHHHARLATEWVVVDFAVLILRIVADVVDMNLGKTTLLCAL